MKKLFGEIDLTWKKLIIFAVVVAAYTALMATLPITRDTSFRDIAINFEWWILFGTIIICNSKTPKDSALKCFVFFLISQPLIYLFQVPFSWQGWGLFKYYKYWFGLTLLTIPMGYIGYYIKENNILSVIIISPMLILLAYEGIGYLSSAIENFPHHLLSCIFCFAFITIIVLNLFSGTKLRLLAFGITIIFIIGYIISENGRVHTEFENTFSLEECELKGELMVSTFTGTKQGNVELIKVDDSYNVRVNCRDGGEYTFEVSDENENICSYRYYYDKGQNTIILEKTN